MERHEPQRQCVGCGCRGPQAGFIRLGLRKTGTPPVVAVVENGATNGRGAYLCRRRACLDRALQRKAFGRAFRTTVDVDVEGILAELESAQRTAE